MNNDEKMIHFTFVYTCDFCDADEGSNPIFLDNEPAKLCDTCLGYVTEGWAKR